MNSSTYRIPFNKPFIVGNELDYIQQAIDSGKISGNGIFTQRCQDYLTRNFHFRRCLLTSSCTDALEMTSFLANIEPGDEIIVPSFTFVSTANAFVSRGAKIVFADSEATTPNIDPTHVESLISPRTKAIVPVHYAGVACEMDKILEIAEKRSLFVIEDAAQALGAKYYDVELGTLGQFATVSFHETKNIICGEGGLLVINDERFDSRSEIIWEKGTNRAAFFRNETSKYDWVDIGSSFLPSEISAAYLLAQLEKADDILSHRHSLWKRYKERLQIVEESGCAKLPCIPSWAGHNAHIFFLICDSIDVRARLIKSLASSGILAVSHYVPLHLSPYYLKTNRAVELINAERYSNCLLRLPLFHTLTESEQDDVICSVLSFFGIPS